MSPPLRLAALVASCALLAACSTRTPSPDAFAGSDADVTGAGTQATGDAVAVDVYLDATTSMEGYAGQGTEYAELLRALEASLVSKWGDADVRLFRFGSRVDSIGRDDYLSARTDAAFYRVPGVFERTNIDSVLARTDADRVSVVVTDLFQDAGDTTELVGQMKDRVFARGLALAVLAVESAFDGTVYDAPDGPYRYTSGEDPASRRPVYALAVGAPAQVERLVETLDGVAGVRRDRSAVVSPYVVDAFELELTKRPGDASKGLNVASADDGAYRFVVRDGYDGGALDGTLRLTRADGAATVDPDRVELAAYRRDAGVADSTLTRDLTLSDVQADGDALSFQLALDLDGPPGRYAYLALFQAGAVDGLTPPAWTRELSTTNPSADVDPNKTLNLERLMQDLVQAAATVQRPLVGRAVLSVTKQ